MRLDILNLRDVRDSVVFTLAHLAGREVLKTRAVLDEGHLDQARRPVALLGDDDLSNAFERGVVGLVILFAEDECDYVSILLDGARFAQVSKLGTVIAATCFRSAAELR